MSLQAVLRRLETKSDADALLAELAAKDKAAEAKADELSAILEKYEGIYSAEALQGVVDRIQAEQSKAEDLEAEIETMSEELQEIGGQLDDLGLSYPYGLDLAML